MAAVFRWGSFGLSNGHAEWATGTAADSATRGGQAHRSSRATSSAALSFTRSSIVPAPTAIRLYLRWKPRDNGYDSSGEPLGSDVKIPMERRVAKAHNVERQIAVAKSASAYPLTCCREIGAWSTDRSWSTLAER